MQSFDTNELKAVSGGGMYDGPLMNYTVQPGETLKLIADKFATKVLVLQELNPIIDDSLTVKPGQVLQVPVRK
ncbi:MAG: LysM domain-containing protein [Eubacteriales bacterium]|nr:LysM domain-containing protein [Eubacteriales bacterium]